jgi:predicted transposase/invertase (TIGR01784 family)
MEVFNMFTREWNQDIAVEVAKEEAREEGREEGWAEGIVEERRKNAKAMKAEGLDTNTIARITGLTVDDILRL